MQQRVLDQWDKVMEYVQQEKAEVIEKWLDFKNKSLAEKQRQLEEARRLAEQRRKEEEARELAERQRQEEEARQLAEQKRREEERRRREEALKIRTKVTRCAEEEGGWCRCPKENSLSRKIIYSIEIDKHGRQLSWP